MSFGLQRGTRGAARRTTQGASRSLFGALTALACALSLVTGSVARAGDRDLLTARMADLVRAADLGDGVSVVVAHAESQARLYSLRGNVPRNPASNMKLVTAATALYELGAEHRFRTTLSGQIEGGTVRTLELRGEGDPSLEFSDLLAMAQHLADLGVRRVEQIVVNGSAFDEAILPPAFEQQPNEVASFRAAVAAVSVDRNAYALRLAPGPAQDAPANVILRCPDHFAIDSTITTTGSGGADVRASQRQDGEQLALTLRGSVPTGILGVAYERRVESPLYYAGHCLEAALRAYRVQGPMVVRIGAESGLPVLSLHESPPLSALLLPVGKHSDNFSAEMLLKAIGAHTARAPGSSENGAARSQRMLQDAGVAAGAATIINGSGLFRGNSIAADDLVKLLLFAYGDAVLRHEYVAQLAIGGADGTLHARLTDLPIQRVVRAKTGTLNDVIALSGYVLGPTPQDTLAFGILVNEIAGKQWRARQLADDLVRAMVDYVYPR